MIEIRRILCPVDFSEFSRRALEYAVALAGWYEARLTVLHVHVIPEAMPGFPEKAVILDPPMPTREAEEELARRLEAFAAAGGVDRVPTTVVVAPSAGGALTGILESARTIDADLVVVGTHGLSGFERLFLGSITEKVLRKAPCPVLTVPKHTREDLPPEAPAFFKRILCPVDFSESSVRALEYGLSLAQETDALLTVLHVVEPPPRFAMGVHGPATPAELSQPDETGARAHVADVIPEGARTYCEIEEVVVVGKPHEEIVRLADARLDDLIVMGVHGRGAVDLMLFGSTTHQVVRRASCPVLTIRH